MEVIKLGITKNNSGKIKQIEKIELLSGKGIVGDRHFSINNNPKNQLTLIESENIDHFNKLVKELPKDRSISVLIQRRDGPVFLAMKLE